MCHFVQRPIILSARTCSLSVCVGYITMLFLWVVYIEMRLVCSFYPFLNPERSVCPIGDDIVVVMLWFSFGIARVGSLLHFKAYHFLKLLWLLNTPRANMNRKFYRYLPVFIPFLSARPHLTQNASHLRYVFCSRFIYPHFHFNCIQFSKRVNPFGFQESRQCIMWHWHWNTQK